MSYYNPQDFAENLVEQVGELVPKDLSEQAKNYLVNTLKNNTLLSGEALVNDVKLNFNADQIVFIVQVIAEWTFHKCIDLAHSEISQGCWDEIIRKIAFNIYAIAIRSFDNEIPENIILKIIEYNVHKTWGKEIDKLVKQNLCTTDIAFQAKQLSNFYKMMSIKLGKSQEDVIKEQIYPNENKYLDLEDLYWEYDDPEFEDFNL